MDAKPVEGVRDHTEEVRSALEALVRSMMLTPLVRHAEGRYLDRVLGDLGRAMAADRVLLVVREEKALGGARIERSWTLHEGLIAPAGSDDPRRILECAEVRGELERGRVVCLEGSRGGCAGRVLVRCGLRSLVVLPLLAGGREWGGVLVESLAERSDWNVWTPHLTPVAGMLGGVLAARQESARSLAAETQVDALERVEAVGSWGFDPDTGRLSLSAAARRLAAEPRAQALAVAFGIVHEDRGRLEAWIESLIESTGSVPHELTVRAGSGAREPPLYLRFRGECLSADGTGRFCRGTVADISLRDAGDRRHRETSELFAALLESSPIVVFLGSMEPEGLRVTHASASLQGITGSQDPTCLETESLASRTHPNDLPVVRARWHRLEADDVFEGTYRLRNADGGYSWVYEEIRRTEGGADGRLVGILMDITERKSFEASVYASERRYRAIVEDAPVFIVRFGADLELSFANAAFLEAFGLEGPIASEHRSWPEFLSEEETQQLGSRLAGLTPSNPMVDHEMEMTLPERGVRSVVWSERGFFDERGDLVEVQAVGRDNTEIRDARERLIHAAKMATVGEMATGAAHEINQPLNVIRMAAHNARRLLTDGEGAQDRVLAKIDRIEGQVSRAANIIDQMRMFGRRSDRTPQWFSVREAIESALVLVGEQFGKNGIALWVETEAGGSDQVLGHRDQLEQVLMNLMVNARDAIAASESESGHSIRVRLTGADAGGTIVLEVSDTGGGIDEGLRERVFEPFFTTKEVGKGTGLGLSISFGIIQEMGGRIEVTNQGTGACFRIELPAG
ncbi:ATP-binding protein [Thioalkalivibrio sp. ALJT]|uniref:ATP-binding protein n=1 Tax=Thioalkalivibrio sp. ALJT TaxID=1158146 RepID=UPI000362539B|nr:ATP-binding protein [Thioalkalivibrio sp. ALJT]